jgi:hypothetical protein
MGVHPDPVNKINATLTRNVTSEKIVAKNTVSYETLL